ncbi:MAG TPA: diguanylate cyclase [Candidatus Baltobacteraceae bacterium]|nr:diguanylate cyclase [Candidatus Baltobacteraceae bacterium]
MTDRDLLWTTGPDLHVTSLSARLREVLFPDGVPAQLHAGGLWQDEDPFGMMAVAHQWVLDGDRMSFETQRAGMHLRVELEPLYDLTGAVAGVAGRAVPCQPGSTPEWQIETLEEVERVCGFGTWRTDLRTGRTFYSPGLYEILGIEDRDRAIDIRSHDHAEDAESVALSIRCGEIAGDGYRCDHRVVRADGTTRYVQEQSRIVYDEHGTAYARVGSLLDITDRKAVEARLSHLAHYDPVSKLPNRTLLEQRLHASLAKAQENDGGCAVLFLDVDNFKRINDTYGHAAGDELLEAIGARLMQHVRSSDTVARLSGDEFVVVLDRVRSTADAHQAARKILASFELPFSIAATLDCRVGVSIGGAVFPECKGSARNLIAAADREMYAVKRNGGRGIKIACASSSSGDPIPLRIAANG